MKIEMTSLDIEVGGGQHYE